MWSDRTKKRYEKNPSCLDIMYWKAVKGNPRQEVPGTLGKEQWGRDAGYGQGDRIRFWWTGPALCPVPSCLCVPTHSPAPEAPVRGLPLTYIYSTSPPRKQQVPQDDSCPWVTWSTHYESPVPWSGGNKYIQWPPWNQDEATLHGALPEIPLLFAFLSFYVSCLHPLHKFLL